MPDLPLTSRSSGTGPDPREAPDLEAHERAVAEACGRLSRPDAPPAVWRGVQRECEHGGELQRVSARMRHRLRDRPRQRLRLGRVPFGAWGVASAALLLVALGVATAIELGHPTALPGPSSRSVANGQIDALTIVDDNRMALFHDVETFDDVGLAPGRLIADWGR